MPALAPTANPTALNRHSQTGLTRSLAVILHEEFGVPFAFYAVPGGMSVSAGEVVGKHPPDFTPEQLELVATTANARVTVRTDGRYQVLLPLREAGQVTLLGVGTLSGFASSRSAVGEECLRLQKWAQSVCDRIALTTKRAVNRRDVQEPGRIGSLPWDAIAGLQNLLQNLHIHKNPSKQQDRILRTARDVLQVQAVMWVP